MVANVGDKKMTGIIEGNTVRSIEQGSYRRTSISPKARNAFTSYCGYEPGFSIHFPNKVIFHFHKVHVSIFAETYFVGFIQFCIYR